MKEQQLPTQWPDDRLFQHTATKLLGVKPPRQADANDGDSATPAERLALACELLDDALEMLRLRLSREHPAWTEDQIERELSRWLHDRPGAEDGDIAGPSLRVRRL